MDRYILSPTTREITVNRAASDSADDLFSYSPDTKTLARTRGHLFVVGHTDQESGTVGYLVSLLAALAKREYYASTAEDAKGAFGQTLRKINEVVAEFTKSDDVHIDVGIFAVAGDELLVSRLGRFRVLLARDDSVLDVLKDVGSFSKEHVENAQFSSIISGPIQEHDRIMAYFPQRALASRERVIKQHLKQESAKVAAHLTSVGKRTKTFTCSALVIDLAQTAIAEEERAPVATPKADTPEPQLAWAPRQATGAAPVARTRPASDGEAPSPTDGDEPQEVPHIIAAEFTRSGRGNPLTKATHLLRGIRLGAIGKFVAVLVVAVAVVGSLWGFRSIFLTDEAAENTRSVLMSAEDTLVSIRTAIDGGDLRSARASILGQLEALDALGTDTIGDSELPGSYASLLNEVDRATPGDITLVTSVTDGDGQPVRGIASSGSASFWVVTAPESGGEATLLTVTEGEIVEGVPFTDTRTDLLIPAEPRFVAVDTSGRILSLVTDDDPIVTTLPTQDIILDASWYNGNVYALTGTSILKVSDIDTSKPVTKQWLTDESDLAANAIAIAVDGDIWTLSRDGLLVKYYRGEQVVETTLPFSVKHGARILTTQDAPEMMITDITLSRVYVVDKETTELVRTITIDTDQLVRDIFLAPDQESLLFITEDGKIWRLEGPR